MNWIERMYEIKGKDPYSQNGEGIYLEYVAYSIARDLPLTPKIADIGAGDGFHLSNSRYLHHIGWDRECFDKITGENINLGTVSAHLFPHGPYHVISIDIDGNDYWILESILKKEYKEPIFIAEFNAAFSDSRTIKYNPDHVWDGTDYYGFSFEAGKKLFEKHGYKVIFNVANMNMIAVREDLIKVTIPTVTYQVTQFFEKSVDREWVMV